MFLTIDTLGKDLKCINPFSFAIGNVYEFLVSSMFRTKYLRS